MTERLYIQDQMDQAFNAEDDSNCRCNHPTCYICGPSLESEEEEYQERDGWTDELQENMDFENATDYFGGDDE